MTLNLLLTLPLAVICMAGKSRRGQKHRDQSDKTKRLHTTDYNNTHKKESKTQRKRPRQTKPKRAGNKNKERERESNISGTMRRHTTSR